MKLLPDIFKVAILGLAITAPLSLCWGDDVDISRAAIGRMPVTSASVATASDITPGATRGTIGTSRMAETSAPASRAAVSRGAVISPATQAALAGATSVGAESAESAATNVTSRVAIAPVAASGTSTISRGANVSASGSIGRMAPGDSVGQSRAAISRAASVGGGQSAFGNTARNSNSKGVINETAAVRRAGVALRPSTAEVGGRAVIAGTDVMTGSNVNVGKSTVTPRVARAATDTAAVESLSSIEAAAAATQSCQQQYMDCMDQFCSIIDVNQKRCSCSARLSNYSKVEAAVKDANDQLNDVAQRIRYVGLSADEIRSIMKATEAELAMQGNIDTTESRNMLEDIEKLIQSPGTFTSAASNTTGLDMLGDITFSADSDIMEMFNLDFNNSNQSFSNMRGTDLYNAAKQKCNAILATCKKNGANTDQITARYDMEIDKDCIAYEKGLEKMNTTLKSNIRSAGNMLEKARLAVLQNQNMYDTKGCIGALDTCMRDDMVCGNNYFKCLDPTKTYIDENGDVILGKNITNIRAMMENYNNAAINTDFISAANNVSMTESSCVGTNNDGSCMVKYLLTKIGTDSNTGLCRTVMDKCRRSTYDNNGNYIAENDVVVNYIQRAMVNIRAAQESIISDYASSCMLDIAQCYNQQVSQVTSWSASASVSSIYTVMTGACRNVALTCAYAVFAEPLPGSMTGTTFYPDETGCVYCTNQQCTATEINQANCINNVSEMFYQSLLCPDNSIYTATSGRLGEYNGSLGGFYVNDKCVCNPQYVHYSGHCSQCPVNSTRANSNGLYIEGGAVSDNGVTGGVPVKGCKCDSGYKTLNGSCVSA